MCSNGLCLTSAIDDGGVTGDLDGTNPPIDSITFTGDGPACKTFSTQFNTCTLTYGADITISGAVTYNTDTHMFSTGTTEMGKLVAGGSDMIDVVAIHNFTITTSGVLGLVGSHPFGIAATGTVDISGILGGVAGGFGARATCNGGAANGTQHTGGAPGGGGGGFHGVGGAGTSGDANTGPVTGATGGMAEGLPAGPLGGCAGGTGGMGATGAGGIGGGGGGAVYIVAAGMVSVSGTINVGGGGGNGGTDADGGGGGGGAGGMILLEAPSASVAGTLAANGGAAVAVPTKPIRALVVARGSRARCHRSVACRVAPEDQGPPVVPERRSPVERTPRFLTVRAVVAAAVRVTSRSHRAT